MNNETKIQSAILKQLKIWNLLVKRETNQNIRNVNGTIKHMPTDIPGWPDIIGVLPNGRMFAIEVKTKTGKMSATQKQTREDLIANNVLHIVATSIDDLTPIKNELDDCIKNGMKPTPSRSLEIHLVNKSRTWHRKAGLLDR